MLGDGTVVITGGTGSFGSVMAAHLLERGCREIRIFSRDEAKQDDMRNRFADSRLRFYIGDVRDPHSLDQVMRGADHVFHAAALKQVPSCEFFPMQAVQTNVNGSANVIDQAVRHGVRSVVCLSTDKAVYPVNAMGMSKALMEKVAQAAARTGSGDTTISCVRYGNVMYSRGSVIPLFVDQIRQARPLTLTEPTMTRFLMPLRDAVSLVEFAFENARPGDIFVRKSAASTIEDLAQAVRNVLSADVPVKSIGMRHGEKVFETLASKEELRRADDLGEYYRVRMDDRDLNYDMYFAQGDLDEASVADYTSHNTDRLDVLGVETLLRSLPEIQALLAELDP